MNNKTDINQRGITTYLALIPICAGVFIAADDQTVIVTVLPEIMLDFNIQITDLDHASWMITAYLLGYVAIMPIIGRVSDVWGHRNMYVFAMFVFIVGSAMAASTTNLVTMIGTRILQAIGAGALIPVSIAIVSDIFPMRRRGIALGIVGASAEAGGVIGPLWGAMIIKFLEWPWVFWINLPLGTLVVLFLILMVKPNSGTASPIDFIGGFLIAISIATLVLGLSRINLLDWWLVGWLVCSGLTFVMFLVRLGKVTDPLVPPLIFHNKTFNGAIGTHLLVGGALIIGMITVPLMANTVLGRTAVDGGLMLMRMTIAIPLGAVIGGFMCQRFGYRAPTILGLILAALGFTLMSQWTTSVSEPELTVCLSITGFGFGLLIAPIALAATNAVAAEYRATAASLITATRIIGMALGVAMLTAWGTGRFEELVAGIKLPLAPNNANEIQIQEILAAFETNVTDAGMALFNEFFLIAAVICLGSVCFAFCMSKK